VRITSSGNGIRILGSDATLRDIDVIGHAPGYGRYCTSNSDRARDNIVVRFNINININLQGCADAGGSSFF
jgi:hypothetical protein